MARYSVAHTKDQLSKLIDKALAGEEVVITRHGQPIVELRSLGLPRVRKQGRGIQWLLAELEKLPPIENTGRPLMEQIRDEYR
jgi:prevent-host-death family protein